MTKPLSTNRLRQLGLAVFVPSPSLEAKGLARSALYASAAELDRLRAVIENAPHDLHKDHAWTSDGVSVCTCWKADAL